MTIYEDICCGVGQRARFCSSSLNFIVVLTTLLHCHLMSSSSLSKCKPLPFVQCMHFQFMIHSLP